MLPAHAQHWDPDVDYIIPMWYLQDNCLDETVKTT